jgi:hypothetical protein
MLDKYDKYYKYDNLHRKARQKEEEARIQYDKAVKETQTVAEKYGRYSREGWDAKDKEVAKRKVQYNALKKADNLGKLKKAATEEYRQAIDDYSDTPLGKLENSIKYGADKVETWFLDSVDSAGNKFDDTCV